MKFVFATSILASLCFVTGCASYVSVTPVKPGEPARGLQYSLPQVFVKMERKGDGTIAVVPTVEPDPNHTYAIHTGTFGGSHESTVDLNDKGLLTKLQWKGDSTAVAKGVVDAGAAITKEVLTAHNTKVADEKKKAEDAEKAAKTEVETAEETVESLTKSVRAKEQEIELAELALAQLDTLTLQQQAQIDVKERELAKRLQELGGENDATKKAAIQTEIDRLNIELAGLKTPNEALRRTKQLDLEKLRRELAVLRQDLQSARNSLAEARQKLVAAEEDMKDIDTSILDNPGDTYTAGSAFAPVLYRLAEVAYVLADVPQAQLDDPRLFSPTNLVASVELRAVPYFDYRSNETVSAQPKFNTVAPEKKKAEAAEIGFVVGSNWTLYLPDHHPTVAKKQLEAGEAQIYLKHAATEEAKKAAEVKLALAEAGVKSAISSESVQVQQIEVIADLPLKGKEVVYSRPLPANADTVPDKNEQLWSAILKDQTTAVLNFPRESIEKSFQGPGIYQVFIGVRKPGKPATFKKIMIRFL